MKPAIPAAPFCLVSPRFCIGHYARCPRQVFTGFPIPSAAAISAAPGTGSTPAPAASVANSSPFNSHQRHEQLQNLNSRLSLRLHPSPRFLLRHSHRCLQTGCISHIEGSGSAPLSQPAFSFWSACTAGITSSAGGGQSNSITAAH